MTNRKSFLAYFLLALSCWFSNAAQAAPQTGWYWNPNESGRGFFVESHDGVTFIGAYLYDTDGHAIWFVAGGPNADPYNYTGDLYNKTGGQTLFGSYVAPGNAVVVGQISVTFSDDTHGTVTWSGGVVQIERQIFGTGTPPFQPFTGWWWNEDQSGSGYSVELQGNNLFIVGFMYDDTGRPVWYYSAGPMSTGMTYHGTVLQFANGQTIGGPYQPPGTPTTVATLDVVFGDVNQATLTFTEASASPTASKLVAQEDRSKIITVKPQLVTPVVPIPQHWRGKMSVTATHHLNIDGVQTDGQWTVDFNNLMWTPQNNGSADSITYFAVPGGGTISANLYVVQSTPAAGSTCVVAAQVSQPGTPISGTLGLSYAGEYNISFLAVLNINATYTCTVNGMTTTIMQVFPLPLGSFDQSSMNSDQANLVFKGAVFDNVIQGAEIYNIGVAGGTLTARWDWRFNACDICLAAP